MNHQVCGYHLANSNLGIESIKKYHSCLDIIMPAWLEIQGNGCLQEKPSSGDINTFTRLKINKHVIPLVQNQQLSAKVSNELVETEAAQQNMIENLVVYLQMMDYKGINLDLEGVNIKNKQNYTDFMANLADSLHQKKFNLGLSIPAKSENNRDSTWSGAYSYHSLGEIADQIMIMAYDYHWAGGPPGPIAPLSWVQDVIDYAIIEIPLEKIYLGIALYGYDWIIGSDNNAEGLSFNQIKAIAQKNQRQIEWDQDSQAPYLRYTKENNKHEIWFENQESIKKKVQLIKQFQLAGIALWRVGLEDEAVWEVVR